MQLREQADHLVLRRPLGAEFTAGDVENLLSSAAAVHQTHHEIGRGGNPEIASRLIVLHDVPDFLAMPLTMNLNVRTQAGAHRRYAVPTVGECGLAHREARFTSPTSMS
jgi:hypothetical protein